ncbi:helix-turn-helix transcriptional regulator [Paenibacillus doosanensis]|uniref:helix-turn-helix transcriptional regulator n=1 Tax=Paenibacillus doosanensis TaxID=1229154 RepID=UPI00217F70DB|nr:helix-turn-helix transcriptional regulator [Paenibacillus doosanensis]MCS7462319.1 helix-turn-helix transcriptional regulator [Paenibacillus doosanensis]
MNHKMTEASEEREDETVRHEARLSLAGMTVFRLTDMNTSVLSLQGAVQFHLERIELPDFLLEQQEECYRALRDDAQLALAQGGPSRCSLYAGSLGLTYIAAPLRPCEAESSLIVVGPFLRQLPDKITAEGGAIDRTNAIVLNKLMQNMKIMSSSQIQTVANLLYRLDAIEHAPLHVVEAPGSAAASGGGARRASRLHEPDDNQVELIGLRYRIQKKLSHAVASGHKAEAQRIIERSRHLFDFSERFPGQPVRALKNTSIVNNTLLRIAAEKGGVPSLYLHLTSEYFAIRIESADKIAVLELLNRQMLDEYCDLVQTHSTARYSPTVQTAVQHLAVYYNKPLQLRRLADACEVHPSHLSRIFKRETGLTLTEFQHRLRLNEAKFLLKTEVCSIDDIAWQVGFEDASYFSRVFKKQEGISPTEFRNSETNKKGEP